MIEFNICLADIPISVKSIYKSTAFFCRDYFYDGPVKYSITIEEEDIAEERSGVFLNFSDQYLETLALYRKIAELLVDEDTILFHSSIIEVEEIAYVFAAPSGVGKSTHTRLWREYFTDKNVHMINDDKPLIKVRNDIIAYGTPWMGKNNIGENRSCPVKAICFLSQGKENRIFKMENEEKFSILLKQTYRSKDKQRLLRTIHLLNKIKKQVPIYRMECNISPEAVKTAFEQMNTVEEHAYENEF